VSTEEEEAPRPRTKRDFPPPRLFATAAKGTEGALRDELREHRFKGVRADRGGVHFGGDLDEGYRACLELRIAVRVLWELTSFDAPNGDALYDGVRSIAWDQWLSPRQTLAVRVAPARSPTLNSSPNERRTPSSIRFASEPARGRASTPTIPTSRFSFTW
jgi:23S rRNA G2445 N2-methylase RlmL